MLIDAPGYCWIGVLQVALTFDPSSPSDLIAAQAYLDRARNGLSLSPPARPSTAPRGELTTCSAFPGVCEAYDEGVPMREISARHLPEGMHNGYAEWNILGAHGPQTQPPAAPEDRSRGQRTAAHARVRGALAALSPGRAAAGLD
jgi:hypothetical protein